MSSFENCVFLHIWLFSPKWHPRANHYAAHKMCVEILCRTAVSKFQYLLPGLNFSRKHSKFRSPARMSTWICKRQLQHHEWLSSSGSISEMVRWLITSSHLRDVDIVVQPGNLNQICHGSQWLVLIPLNCAHRCMLSKKFRQKRLNFASPSMELISLLARLCTQFNPVW